MIAFLLLLGLLPLTAGDPLYAGCDSSANYTSGSSYHANLELLSTALPSNASSAPFLFAKGSVGGAPATVYGLTLCRGDTNASICHACVATAFQEAQRRLCILNKDATVFYDLCLLRYSYKDFLSSSNGSDAFLIMWNTQNITEPLFPGWDPKNSVSMNTITAFITGLVEQTAEQAANNSARFATGRMDISSTFPRLFSLAQCTPDMAPTDCSACLHRISQQIMKYFSGRKGGRILGVRCNFRYEVYKFYEGEPMRHIGSPASPPEIVVPSTPGVPPTAPLVVPSNKHGRRTRKVLVISLVVPLLATFFCLLIFLGFRRHRRGKGSKENAMTKELENEALVWEMEGRSSEFTMYNFSQILEATNNFSEENKLGQGGFGPVYKGRFPDGLEIAVKRLASQTGQGFTEFKNEIQLIAKLQHTNLVRLFGCCTQGEEKILIYEYLPNKSLDFFIFGNEARRNTLDWNRRLAIIDGIAQGLLYLHKHSRLRVIHRDLKASNILLDNEMNPKISDFGLAKIFSKNDSEASTQRIVGTHGYMAPEYASEGLFSTKSDVFSFGVLTLEIVSGKRTSSLHRYGDFINILGHAWQLWKDGSWLQLLDASLATGSHTMEMTRGINIALLCVQENAADRPTMSDVVAMLNSESMTLPEPKHSAYFHTRVAHEDVSTVVVDAFQVTMSALQGR